MTEQKKTKKDIAKQIAGTTGMSQRIAAKIVQQTLDLIVRALADQGRIELRNFGVFTVESRSARKARNPQTGADVFVPAKDVVVFKPGKTLKDKVQRQKKSGEI